MSLFENPQYQWRETYFVLFDAARRPGAQKLQSQLERLGNNFEVTDVRADDDGLIDSLTIFSRDDFAAMDVSCTAGEEVAEHVPALLEDVRGNIETDDERSKFERLRDCTARLDIFHFQQQSREISDELDDDFMDPGGLLVVLDRLGEICDGVVCVDPQSGALL